MVDNTRGFDAAGVYKAQVSDDLTNAGLAVPVTLSGGDGVWVNGASVDVKSARTMRVHLFYVAGTEASVDVQGELSDDGGTSWCPASVIEPASSGLCAMKNSPLHILPTGTSSVGVDGAGSFLVGLSADSLFRMRWRCNTPGVGPGTLLMRGRRGFGV